MNSSDMPSNIDRAPATSAGNHVRVDFDLSHDEQGYPPAKTETLWAVPVGPAQFRLDNIPFFVCGVSCFDVIEALKDGTDRLKYHRLLTPSGHSTLRVIFLRSGEWPNTATGACSRANGYPSRAWMLE